MLNEGLIDVINSGDAWAFVGNGSSADAGVPSWEKLLEITMATAAAQYGPMLGAIKKDFEVKAGRGQLTEAFSILKGQYSSKNIDDIVCGIINKFDRPGAVPRKIASWPFQAYVTTNYDHLIESALEQYGGWVSVGNTAGENRKISGDVSKIVWHPHGGAQLGDKNSRLVLAKSDYDEVYPARSVTLATLEAIVRLKRIIFIGFGFRDPDLIAMLSNIGRFISPDRPAYAFLANTTEEQRNELWDRYMVEVIPYVAHGHDHSDLLRVLDAYGAFVIDRSIQFGRVATTPSYNIETVSLLTETRLARSGWLPKDDAKSSLVRAFILAKLKLSGGMEESQLINDLEQFSSLPGSSAKEVIYYLSEKGAIARNNKYLSLTDLGSNLADEGKAKYELVKDQFKSSVLARARSFSLSADKTQNICDVTVIYLEKTCRERGLGVAQQLSETGVAQTKARAVALLQDAKSVLDFSKDKETALATIQCIRNILSGPKPEERQFLGYLTQAFFAKHLLGVDPAAIGVKKENLTSTVFIADSNFIIPLLAEGSIGHAYAKSLFNKLSSIGCLVVTSDLLLTECIEHAKWAWDLINKYGINSAHMLDVLRGAHGYKQNAFLYGYLNNKEFGPDVNFKRYFAKVFGNYGEAPQEKELIRVLEKIGIFSQPLSSWTGFVDELYHEMEYVQGEIKEKRIKNNTYKHERQVKAEAEVAVIVTQVRSKKISFSGKSLSDAYFLSYSRVVDRLPGQAQKVCIVPESLYEWLLTISDISDDDANSIYDQLLWEISKEGIDIVPRQQLLLMFHNTIDASRQKFYEVVEEYRDVIRDIYVNDPEKAFSDIDPLLIPSFVESVSKEALRVMQNRLEEEKLRRSSAERVAKSVVIDQKEFEKLKAEKKQRQAKAKKKQRAAASHHKKKKK